MAKSLRCPSCNAPLEVADFYSSFDKCEFCGSNIMLSSDNYQFNEHPSGSGDLLEQARKLKEIKRIAHSGNKIEAIRLYRETFGSSLKEASETIENIVLGKPVIFSKFQSFTSQNASTGFGESVEQALKIAEIQGEIQRGNKINAIKIYRETFNVGLAEAKDAVERMERGESIDFQKVNFQTQNRNIGFQNVNVPAQNITPDELRKKAAKTAGIFGGSILGIILIPMIVIGVITISIIWMVTSSVRNITSNINFSIPNIKISPKSSATPSLARETLRFGGDGIGAGYFKDNRVIAVDGDGKVYSADYSSGRIQQFDSNGKFLTQWIAGENMFVQRIIADRKGRVYVLDSSILQIYDGSTQQIISKIDKPNYRDIARSSDGKLYAITNNNEFAKLDENGKIISKSDDLTKQINFKVGNLLKIVIDGLGNFYVSENRSNNILKFSPDAKFQFRFDSTGGNNKKLGSIYDLAVNGKGRIFATDAGRVHIFDNEGHYLGLFDANQTFGLAFDDKGSLWTATRPFVIKYEVNQ